MKQPDNAIGRRGLSSEADGDAERDDLHKRSVTRANGGEIQILLLQRGCGMNNA